MMYIPTRAACNSCRLSGYNSSTLFETEFSRRDCGHPTGRAASASGEELGAAGRHQAIREPDAARIP